MNDPIAILVKDLAKMYKLYNRSHDRLLDFLGFSRGPASRCYDEYWALKGVTFDIAKGTTVGVIGRNGAGKSTLLKLLAGASAPTRGEVVANGRVAALLELSTGFHPDLTGHENIFASGLYLGLDQPAMESLYGEIVAFAELGEFLRRPVRTYSTGMQMRLAFSVASSVPADVQLIDEVLGVGDAYFFGKCLQRFQRFQREGRTTVLVSHDFGTILRLCSRCLWIDRGVIAADGTPLEVIRAYTQAIYEERDRAADAQVSVAGVDLGPAQSLRRNEAVNVLNVEFVNAREMPVHAFSIGETLTVRVRYRSRTTLLQPVVSVTVYRTDGVTVCNAISSMDGAQIDLPEGEGTVDARFDNLQFGPGEYTVAVGIYPSLDLADSASMQHAVIWHKPLSFLVRQVAGVSVDLGVVRHPVQWRARSLQAAATGGVSGEAS